MDKRTFTFLLLQTSKPPSLNNKKIKNRFEKKFIWHEENYTDRLRTNLEHYQHLLEPYTN